MEKVVPVQIVPEDEETLRQEAAFVAAVTEPGVGQALADAALEIGVLLVGADLDEEVGEGATPSGEALR